MKISIRKSLPICETLEENYKYYDHYYREYYRSSENLCFQSCKTKQYEGKHISTNTGLASKTYVPVLFWFSTNEREVHTEYLIYDTSGFIGSVGGTFGLFIGFSFHDVLKKIIFTLKNFFTVRFFNSIPVPQQE